MKTFTYRFKLMIVAIATICALVETKAQSDNKVVTLVDRDTSKSTLNMDAIYNRPFLLQDKLPISIGGYLEANSQYATTDGVTDGLSFQMRRMTLFFSSTVAERIKFFSELEFEDGTKTINIETAIIDVAFHNLLNLRGGIIMAPIGAFNQNHDGPRWDFTDRPLSATTLLPATFSNVGFGLHGKYYTGRWIIGYESYLTNGLDDRIINNADNRTSLPAGKSNINKFNRSNSGMPMFNGKLAIRNRKIGELGLSYMTGVFNKWRDGGLTIDDKRSASALAIDFNTSIFDDRITLTGEVAKVMIDVPDTYIQSYGKEQFGGYLDIIGNIFNGELLKWNSAKINLGMRLEYIDYNQGTFKETGGTIKDHLWSIMPSIAFRPVSTAVFRFNYRYQEQTDLLGNPAALTGIFQFGFSSYF